MMKTSSTDSIAARLLAPSRWRAWEAVAWLLLGASPLVVSQHAPLINEVAILVRASFQMRAGQKYTVNTVNGGTGGSADLGLTHMSNDYWFFKPGTGATTFDVDANFPSAVTSPRATVLSFDTGGNITETEITLDGNGDGGLAAPITFDSTVSKVVIVVTNASTRFTNCNTDFQNPPFFSCAGQPRARRRARPRLAPTSP